MVDLEDPGFEARVQHHVEAQHLEAHRVLQVVRLATLVNVRQLGLNRADGLDDRLLDVSLHLLYIVALRLQIAPDKGQRTFVAYAVVVLTFVLDELRTILINCIVG